MKENRSAINDSILGNSKRKKPFINKRFIILGIIIFISVTVSAFFYLTRETFSVPVLMYHYITSEESPQEICVSKQRFEEQIKYLKDNGYKFLTVEDVYKLKKDKRKYPRKAVVITFDDGYSDIYYNALPVMKKYGAKGTVFVISDKVGEPMYLNEKELKELHKSGYISIGSHTVSHIELNTVGFERQLSELKLSKEKLEGIIGSTVDHISYPYGKYNEDTLKAAEIAGYTMGFSVDGDYTRSDNKYYDLRRFWAMSDFEYFKEVCNVSKISDLKYFLMKIAGK
jgi:peptidoglycan/xylan/chitin deacetylase (PgdA/CDA1 family)